MNTLDHQHYITNGFVVAKQLFSADEADAYRDHYMTLRRSGTYEGDYAGIVIDTNDPLKQYPRMIHMHRWDKLSLDWMLDKRITDCLSTLLGKAPYAVQTMLYFKPPGSRGQALHQDQHYLRVQPGTCMAAWMALDDCDEANGCLQVVPASHTLPLLCTTSADLHDSFTDVTVPLSDDMQPVPIHMQAGDVLFFNGQLIHGSFPNTTTNRFRRALIGHYIVGDAQQVAQFYHPVLRLDGTEVELAVSDGGGRCGIWVDENGSQVLELIEPENR